MAVVATWALNMGMINLLQGLRVTRVIRVIVIYITTTVIMITFMTTLVIRVIRVIEIRLCWLGCRHRYRSGRGIYMNITTITRVIRAIRVLRAIYRGTRVDHRGLWARRGWGSSLMVRIIRVIIGSVSESFGAGGESWRASGGETMLITIHLMFYNIPGLSG